MSLDTEFYSDNYRALFLGGESSSGHFERIGRLIGLKPSENEDPVLDKIIEFIGVDDTDSSLNCFDKYGQLFDRKLLHDSLFRFYAIPKPKKWSDEKHVQDCRRYVDKLNESYVQYFGVDGMEFKVVSPDFEDIFNRLENGSPFAFVRRPHVVWQWLHVIEGAIKHIKERLPGNLLTSEELFSLVLRAGFYSYRDNIYRQQVFQENWMREVVYDLSTYKPTNDFLCGVAFRGYPTWDHSLFGYRNIDKDVYKNIVRIFSRYFSPDDYLLDGCIWKKIIIHQGSERLVEYLKTCNVVLVAPEKFRYFGEENGIKDFFHYAIPDFNTMAIRNRVLDQIKSIVDETGRRHKRTVMLFQCGASVAGWLIARLHNYNPGITYIDLGQAMDGIGLKDPVRKDNDTMWMQIYRPIIAKHHQAR